MDTVEAELFSPRGNNAVVRLPGRRFPGVLVQGDSLSVLLSQTEVVEALVGAGDTARAAEELAELANSLADMLKGYEAALEAHGMRRPYNMTFRRRP